MPCLVCGAASTVKSHILPRAFIHEIRAGEPNALIGRRHVEGRKFTQSGTWDDGILCDVHEQALHASDTYAVEFCRTFLDHAVPVVGASGYEVPNPSPHLLTRFVMSVVWRYVVSRLGRADRVSLGPYEARLRSLVFSPASAQLEPDIMICRSASQLDGRTIPFAVDPHSGRVGGLIYWRFLVSSLDFRMKLDARRDGMPDALLANGKDPLIVCDLGAEDIRQVPAYQAIFARMAAGRGP